MMMPAPMRAVTSSSTFRRSRDCAAPRAKRMAISLQRLAAFYDTTPQGPMVANGGMKAAEYVRSMDGLMMATFSEVDVSWMLKSRPPTIEAPSVSKYRSLTLLKEAMASARDVGV